jgi:hypothetical protein
MIRYMALLTTSLFLAVSCSGGPDSDATQVAMSAPTATVVQLPTLTPTNVRTALRQPTTTLVPSAPTLVRVPSQPTISSSPSTPVYLSESASLTTIRSLTLDPACSEEPVEVNFKADELMLEWEFNIDPALSSLFLRTRPHGRFGNDPGFDGHRNYSTNGFGFLWYRQVEVPVLSGVSYIAHLPYLEGLNPIVDIELVTVNPSGLECESRLYTGFPYPESDSIHTQLKVPNGATLNRDRYKDLVVPAPTVEALIYAFAAYTGKHITHEGEPEYLKWSVTQGNFGGIQDYSPVFRTAHFGETQTLGDWQASARIIEVLTTINPKLEPGFATTVGEVTFPQFHPVCEPWIIKGVKPFGNQTKLQFPCQRDNNGAYFASGPTDFDQRDYYGVPPEIKSRGFIYYNTFFINEQDLARPDLLDRRYKLGDEIANPCCSMNFHEIGHAFGLSHNLCGYSSMSFWRKKNESYLTRPWNEDDLAGIAVHLDPRTKHGMTIDQAADALGIPKDERFNELIAKPWRACGNQNSGWDEFADRLYVDWAASPEVRTNHPENRMKITWPY